MIVRLACVGLAVAGLAGPFGALAPVRAKALQTGLDVQTDNADEPATAGRASRRGRRHARAVEQAAPEPEAVLGSDPAAEGDAEAPARPMRRRPIRPKSVVILPPARPVDAAAPAPEVIATASLSPDAATGRTGEAIGNALQSGAAPLPSGAFMPVVTAARPAQIETAPTSPAAPVGQTPAFVSIMPPLRPSFPSEVGGGPEVAPAQPLADVTTPDGIAAPSGKFVYVLPPARPVFRHEEDNGAALPGETPPGDIATLAPEASTPQTNVLPSLFEPGTSARSSLTALSGHGGLDAKIADHARLNGVPVELVHRVVIRESKYNPRAVGHGGALGLMQIKHGTARALGYMGPASGLLDADTNLTYAVKYLAGAYRTAGGDFNRAVSYYARGYYYAAKRSGAFRTADRRRRSRGAGDATQLAAETSEQ